jgi:hypothetical protein
VSPLDRALRDEAFAFVPAARMREALGDLSDWSAFASSWDGMPLDTQLPDGHRYRRRRYATLTVRRGESTFNIESHQPHYQSKDYNRLVGGIERWFEPIAAPTLASASFTSILRFCSSLFGPMKPGADWHVECHQFRIEARSDAAGQPTPEGVHRDGVDYVLVLLVSRENIASGTTTIHDQHGKLLGSFTLAAPLDSALVDDARVMHGVTAVTPENAAKPAHRDVLVVTFRAKLA